ncbi:hypothetical protein KPL76_10305 [Subtercola sp. PAMC28395]|uniref:hypothetical protein n=1 Tax=Subtercola sp. PAMC28395 TaxID=2846775 RepID=UPI001C0E2A8E|nr:hypothetical protein [Subtercola sp. PAMC28395]QWT23137.1 hypothetical protein KPL76_10305 [Subtercola sp. PAMC28395]
MSDMLPEPLVTQTPPTMIIGRVTRKTNNSLVLTFNDGPASAPLAVAQQGGADGVGSKLGVLFGFKNGGSGQHVMTMRDGSVVTVVTSGGDPTRIVRGPGSGSGSGAGSAGEAIATVERGDVSKVILADGTHLFTIIPDPVEPKSPELYRLRVVAGGSAGDASGLAGFAGTAGDFAAESGLDVTGSEIGRLDVILQPNAWRLGLNNLGLDGVIGDLADLTNMSGRSSLPILVQGTRLIVTGQLSELQRDILCAICVDLAIGLRPYVKAMR